VALVLSAAPALSAPGELDTTFSGDGVRRVSFVDGSESVADVVLPPDGRVVLVGSAGGDMTAARLRSGGRFDPAFSGDGRQTIDVGGDDRAFGATRQGDRLVLAGISDERAALVRLRNDGKRDRAFSDDGQVTVLPAGCVASGFRAAAAGPGGTIVAVGDCQDTGLEQLGLVTRFTERGRLDRTFSGDGIKKIVRSDDVVAVDVSVLPDGRILVLLWGSGQDNAVLRLRPNGSVDTSFGGGDGLANLPDDWSPQAMARAGTGLVVAAGGQSFPGPTIYAARLRADGTRSPTFGGGDGRVEITDAAIGETIVTDVAVQANRRILISAENGNQLVIRLTGEGALDASFNGGLGFVEVGGAEVDGMSAIAVDAAERIVAGGSLGLPGPGFPSDQIVYRFLSR
jgi:uncharacterized delta-60 repeat protein